MAKELKIWEVNPFSSEDLFCSFSFSFSSLNDKDTKSLVFRPANFSMKKLIYFSTEL